VSARTPVSPCCVGRTTHAGPDCVWPSTTPSEAVLARLGRALWDGAVMDEREVYVDASDDDEIVVDGRFRMAPDLLALVRLARPAP
jgi:hypothetical protein